MGKGGCVSIAVINDYKVAVSAVTKCFFNHAICCGVNGSPFLPRKSIPV